MISATRAHTIFTIPTLWFFSAFFSIIACSPASTETSVETLATHIGAPPEASIDALEKELSFAEQHRWVATAGVTSGLIMRVEAASAAQTGDRLAGYLIRPGTERPLSNQNLEQLVALIRSKNGFDDSVIKRCQSGLSVGFLLTLDSADNSGKQEISGLVLDFGCNRLTIDSGTNISSVQSYYFDPSRATFIQLVKSALSDEELDTLK